MCFLPSLLGFLIMISAYPFRAHYYDFYLLALLGFLILIPSLELLNNVAGGMCKCQPRTVKAELYRLHGWSRFRQRLLHDGCVLENTASFWVLVKGFNLGYHNRDL